MSEDISEYSTFGTVDYVLFFLLLLISCGVGVYFGFFEKRPNTTKEYLLGGNRLKVIPVGISLVASQLSAISLMALPAELYSFGFNETFGMLAMFVSFPVMCWVILPIFFENNIINCYEYLEHRFDKKTRHAMTAIFVLTVCLSMPVYIFIPSLAFAQVTGINIHLINGVVCFVCVFYTMLGGIKAVVWTDVIQGVIMLGSMILICALAIPHIGGFENFFKYNYEGGRFDFNTKFDLTSRATVWNVFFGYCFLWVSYVGFNQTNIQRFAALPTLAHAQRSLWIVLLGFVVVTILSYSSGLLLFAAYHDCDPIKAGLVTQADKMMSFFVQDVVGHLKGIPGTFISAVFSASLSTNSAFLNSLSGIVYFDYVKPFINHTEKKANLIMKAVVFCGGVYCFLGGFVVENFESMMQLNLSVLGMTHGTIFGTFMLGMLVPRAHGSTGFYGMIFSLVILMWIVVVAQLKFISGEFRYTPLPTRVDGCDSYNITIADTLSLNTSLSLSHHSEIVFSVYTISFHWYKLIGAVCVWIVAIPLSYLIPRKQEHRLNAKLLAPMVRGFLPPEQLIPEETPFCEMKNYNQQSN